MLNKLLPSRYRVTKAFVVDALGHISEQIDLVIHDRQYSPLLFNYRNAEYIPAESVYAVFEVKQMLTKSTLEYAASKAASVRRLRRTSVDVVHAGGKFPAKKPFEILAGVLALEAGWKGDISKKLCSTLDSFSKEMRLDLGCVVARAGFEADYSGRRIKELTLSDPSLSVSFFVIRLLSRLQRVGTVPALDLDRYLRAAMKQDFTPPGVGKGRTKHASDA
jgi:hypothetical protein